MLESIAHTGPRRQLSRRGESTLADGLLCVRHPTPHGNAAFVNPTKIAECRVRNGGNFGNRGHA